MIEIHDLDIRIGNLTLIKKLSLAISQGERIAIVGANGCGKSTLLRTIAGLHPTTGGSIIISGKTANLGTEILTPPSKRKISMVFQELGLWPNLDVKNNILLGRSPVEPSRWRSILTSLALEDLGDELPGRLSGGQRQRVAIARTLLYPADWLLLDEPFSAIDQDSRELIADEIGNRAEQWNAGILCATHHPMDLELLRITRIFQLDEGQLSEFSPSVSKR